MPYTEVSSNEFGFVLGAIEGSIIARTINLQRRNRDASYMHIGPLCVLTSGLTYTASDIKSSHARLDTHEHEHVMIMGGKSFSYT